MRKIEQDFNPATLKVEREARGYSRPELARILGVSYFAVSTWERGEKKPKVATLKKLSRKWKVPYSYWLQD